MKKENPVEDWATIQKFLKDISLIDEAKKSIDKLKHSYDEKGNGKLYISMKTIDAIKSILKKCFQKLPKKPELDDKEEENILENIKTASKPAEKLAKWAFAIIKYGEILTQVDPWRQKIMEMNQQKEVLDKQINELVQTITQSQQNIDKFKKEYEELVTQTEELKVLKENVTKKIVKAENLLAGLSSEKTRWS